MELDIDKCRSITQLKHLSDAELVTQIVKSHNDFYDDYEDSPKGWNKEGDRENFTYEDFYKKSRKELWKEYLIFRAYKKNVIEEWETTYEDRRPEKTLLSKILGKILFLIGITLMIGQGVCILAMGMAVFLWIFSSVEYFEPSLEYVFFLSGAILLGLHILVKIIVWFGDEYFVSSV